MNFPADPILRQQLPGIARIIRDEIWLEAERRGQTVPPDDPVVRANVCAVILRIGARMRADAMQQITHELMTASSVRRPCLGHAA